MRREWCAAGRDVAQVREGAETSPQRVGAAWAVGGRNAGAAREREKGARKRQRTLWKNAGAVREGSGVVGSGVDSLRK